MSLGKLLKAIGLTAGGLLALPAGLLYALLRPVLGRDRALSMVSESVALWPGLLGIYLRQAFCRLVLPRVGRDVTIGFLTVLSKADAELGDAVYLGRGCMIGRATIADGALLADGVQVLSGRHQHGSRAAGVSPDAGSWREQAHQYQRVRIGAGAWIGAGAIILADVGDGALVAAGAVVVKPVPAGMQVAGVPARPMASPNAAQAA